jgi:group I intron endonuclease
MKPEERWKFYKNLNCKGQPKLYYALKKYGPDNFHYELIDIGYGQMELDRLEKTYIKQFDSMLNGYNCNEGGVNAKHTENTKQKMSNAHMGKTLSVVHRRKISDALSGKIVSIETRQKLSLANTGRIPTKETCERISIANKGKFRGCVITPKPKMPHANKGRKQTPECIAKRFANRRHIYTKINPF